MSFYPNLKQQNGSLHAPLVVALFCIVFAGMGVWSVLRHWRFVVSTQLRLDRCVGETTQELRDTLNSINSDNVKIDALRAAIVAAELQPELIPPLEAALMAVVGAQDLTLLRWDTKQVQWLARGGCGRNGDTSHPLSSLTFVRYPPDVVGPQTLTWEGEAKLTFRVSLSHPPRAASAEVEGGSIDHRTSQGPWKARWADPAGDQRSDIP